MTTTNPTKRRRSHAIASALAVTGLTLSLAACGDGAEDDPAAPASPGTTAATTEASTTAPATSAEPEAASDDTASDSSPAPTGDDEQRFGVSLEQTGDAITEVLEDVEGYTVDGDVLTVTIGGDTSASFDGMLDCLSLGGLMSEGETLVLEYPDGSEQC